MISTALLIYLLVGPMAWVLLFLSTLIGRSQMTRLLKWPGDLPPAAPKVTILIPAKDEGPGIRRCVEGVLQQDYPDFEAIAIDDRSVDDTGRALDELAAAAGPKLTAIHIERNGLPAGWLGKCHALWVASRRARGDWLLLVDSDVTLQPQALRIGLSAALARGYDAISILTRLECHTFLQRLMLPLLGGAWAVMNGISLTNNDQRTSRAYANGQFFLVRRSAYEAAGGHEAVKDQITEDVELMRRLKQQGGKVRLLLGRHLASTRMHTSLPRMFSGWSRIYSGTGRRRPWRILAAMGFIIASGLSAYAALGWAIYVAFGGGGITWLAAAAAHLVLMTLYVMTIYQGSGNPKRYALLFPLGAAMLLAIYAYSLRKCWTGRITWRDTEFVQSRPGGWPAVTSGTARPPAPPRQGGSAAG